MRIYNLSQPVCRGTHHGALNSKARRGTRDTHAH